jgi:anti-sigma factor RsiW
MTCREILDFLMRYLDGELSDVERQAFEAHLFVCPPCVAYLDTYKQAVRLGRLAAQDEQDPCQSVPEELVRAILAARARASQAPPSPDHPA